MTEDLKPRHWEYKVVAIHVDGTETARLNELGMEGWELISLRQPDGAIHMHCVFKRAVKVLTIIMV